VLLRLRHARVRRWAVPELPSELSTLGREMHPDRKREIELEEEHDREQQKKKDQQQEQDKQG
jgi:hypothetical protein